MAKGYDRHALAALEARAVRDTERSTYNASLGAVTFSLALVLAFTLPSPWRVLNGEWSSRVLPSLLALSAHGAMVVCVLVTLRCLRVQCVALWEQFLTTYLGARRSEPAPASEGTSMDPLAALNNVVNLSSLSSLNKPPASASSALSSLAERASRSFFDPPPVTTVEEGKAYLRRMQRAMRERESDESSSSAASMLGSGPGGVAGLAGGGAGFGSSIFGAAGLLPRVYQASGFDPYQRDASLLDKEVDPLTTSSNPQVAWAQLDDLGLAMFMHLYVRNIRRLLACHVKDFVEAFVQNALELNECGVLADVLLRRVPSQALLCPAGQQQLTNVSLYDMLHGLAQNPAFISKTRGVHLFAEHVTFDKYLNVVGGGAAAAAGSNRGQVSTTTSHVTEYSSLERQQYVLERLIVLSKDRNLDRFRWDTGASWKGKEWSSSLPSDAEILMNVFSCILDNMLPADNERDRPFWKAYFYAKAPRRPFTARMRNRLYVVQTVQRPPHFKVLAKGAVREVVPWEENTFHTIVVYLHALKKMKAGHLDSINLRRILDQVFDVAK